MENASKALIMAGTILISIMVISLGVYIINMFGEYTARQEQERANQQIAEFNAQFLKYEGRTDITAQDIVTVANLAEENNKFYEFETEQSANENMYYIQVDISPIISGQDNFEFEDNKESILLTESNYITSITNPAGETEKTIKTYWCKPGEVIVSPVTKRVYKITFKEVP